VNWVITDGPSNATASSVLAAISGRLAGIRMGSNRRRWRVIWTHAPDDGEIRISQRQQSAASATRSLRFSADEFRRIGKHLGERVIERRKPTTPTGGQRCEVCVSYLTIANDMSELGSRVGD